MPSKHRYPAITPRPAPELRDRAKQAVSEVNSSLNRHIIEFLRWLVGDTDELPERPARRIPPMGPETINRKDHEDG
ncbi:MULTISPECIES: hypothetical protein [Mycolicibacter]|uniref:Uncharacterized protein n=1 Tax=Mycolicibacter longobardus TaxID=1108812 RepID=A0A1X1YAB8_9MYCO|nr:MULTISPECIES: hypothetical protein [Mycolicibacter]ORW08038.1 hypothetical protein AWC16_20080 [Mycolicibacter longobardus]RAV04312.1 hypothetical protein DQP56_00390 [Mycolicibacter senuensis]